MSHAWKQWEGQVANGEFPLLRYLGGSEHSAVFLTEFHEAERLLKAAIKLIPAPPENGEFQLSRWRMAAELSHPHLISLFGRGRCEVGGKQLLYLVMESAEENLAQVLPSRALTPGEAREMLDSVLDVLAYLHSKGFVHGHIKPINIMANGDQLKVSSDGLCRAGESLEHPGGPDAYGAPENAPEAIAGSKAMSPASDVWSLGMTLVETLTQNLPAARTAKQQELLVPPTLPEPFLDIARHCLVRDPQERWTVVQIAARLQERSPAPQVGAPMLQSRAPARPPQPKATRLSRPPAKRHGYGIPVAAGVVLVLAAIVAWPRLSHRHSEVIEEEPISEAPTPLPTSVHPETAREEPTNRVAKLPAGAVIRGEVAQQVLPDVLESARNTIRGTVRVTVNVDVDRAGNVEDAQLESSGPSKYFARAALQAAEHWKFKPPNIGGGGVLSSWNLRFKFTRDGTTVIPTQELP